MFRETVSLPKPGYPAEQRQDSDPVQCFPCSRTVWITAWPLFTPFPLCCGRSTLPRPPNPRLGHHLLWPAACVEASNLLKILCHPSHSEEESIPPFVSLIGPVTCFDQQNVAKRCVLEPWP